MSGVPQVGFDIRRATMWPRTGIARYGRNLLRAMLEAEPRDLRIRPIDTAGAPRWPDAIAVGRSLPAWRRALQEQVRMTCVSARLQLLHLPWSEGPVRPRCPLVLTLFDLATLENPSVYGAGFRAYYHTLLRRHMGRAALVIVSSEATLEAARERWPLQRFRLIPLAVDPVFAMAEEAVRTPEPTVLYTGGFDPRKRVGDLVEAVARVRASVPSVELVLSGDPPPRLIGEIRARLDSGVVFTGYLSDEQLACWYQRAWAVAYPSSAEGFGFPIVEAFASGTPLVATRAGSIAEVAQGAALLVEPGDVVGLADAIIRLLTEPSLGRRLREAGLEVAATVAWSDVARSTLDAYREVLAAG